MYWVASPKGAVRGNGHELAGIEVLRFLCALVIVVHHYENFFFIGEFSDAVAKGMRPQLPFYWLLRPVYDEGFVAVQIFWAISGFIFYWHYSKSIAERRVTLGDFAIRRFSRLYPLHFCTLMLVALLQFFYLRSHGVSFIFGGNTVSAFVEQLFFGSNWFWWQTASAYTFNGPIWSISAEILVYFLFFAVARTFGASPMVAFVIGLIAWGLAKINSSVFIFNTRVLECAVYFFAGGVTCWLYRQRFALILSTALLAILIALLATRAIEFRFGALLLLACNLVVCFARFGETKAGAHFRHVAFLGNATYSSYLMHFPIQLAIVSAIDAAGYSRNVLLGSAQMGAYLAIVVISSLATYHWLELPAQNWIRRRPWATTKRLITSPRIDPL